MDSLSYLQQLGLPKNDALVYEALLSLGQTTVGPVVKKTDIHRQLVYEALERLEEKGLASYVLKNNRKHFQAARPTELLKLVEEQETAAQKVIPVLEAIQAASIDSIEVRTLYGKKGFFDNLKDVIDSAARQDKTMKIIGGAKDTDFYTTIGDRYSEYVDLLQKKQVQKQLIAPENFSEEFKQKFATEKGNVLKTLPVGLSSPSYTRITPDMVSIEIYSSEVTVIQIKNKAIAQGYLDHFNLLWNQAVLFRKLKT